MNNCNCVFAGIRPLVVFCLVWLSLVSDGSCAESSNTSLYWDTVRRYADTMIERGSDSYGRVKSPLMAAALDRNTLRLFENPPAAPTGIRPQDRMLKGANPMHDENLYRLLYALSDISGEAKYGKAADDSLRFFLTNCQSVSTGLLPWGEHLGWDFQTEQVSGNDLHEFYRPWVLWDRSYELAPETMRRFAVGLWEHQIFDHQTGNFSRHAKFSHHGPQPDSEFPRHAGFYIATWSVAYAKDKNPAFVNAIETMVDYFEKRRLPDGGFPARSLQPKVIWWESDLSWAIDVWEASARMPKPLKNKMRAAASKTDTAFLRAHRLQEPAKDLWDSGYGKSGAAAQGLLCHLRFKQTGDKNFRELVLSAAKKYSQAELPEYLHPGAVADAITLELVGYLETGNRKFLDEADRFGRAAVKIFWNGKALPCASSEDKHYEAITRGDSLALALLDLWSQQQRGKTLGLQWIDR